MKPADGDWEGVEGDLRGGDFCVAVSLHHTQHKTEQNILSCLSAFITTSVDHQKAPDWSVVRGWGRPGECHVPKQNWTSFVSHPT